PLALSPGAPCRFDVRDAGLGPLMAMGGNGNLPVHPLLPGSPAIDAASDSTATDQQRDSWIAVEDAPTPQTWTVWDRLVDGNGDGVPSPDLGAYEMNLRWQTELLAVQAMGPASHVVVTTPSGYDRGAGTSYAATSAGADQFVTYVLPIAQAGTYSISVGVMKSGQSGQFQLAVAEDPAGPWTNVGGVQDTYASSPVFGERNLETQLSFSTA